MPSLPNRALRGTRSCVTVRAPGKVNVRLNVGPRRVDGYHDLATIFQAVAIYDEVVVELADCLKVTVTGPEASLLLDYDSNLVTRAARLVAARASCEPNVSIRLRKVLPVAGGMAGGSADGAAALVACNALWNVGLGTAEMLDLAGRLGSDVPFMLTGGTAIGRGRGELLTPIASRVPLHWVFAFPLRGLSTAEVYARYDRIIQSSPAGDIRVAEDLRHAIEHGEVEQIAKLMHNDLTESALQLQPHLAGVLRTGLSLGARGAILCGTGASCAFLAGDRLSGKRLATALSASGLCRAARYAMGPASGVMIVPP
jgi:4-diphosphocytidyl-2-C-methyl-D-erythritol kinase